MSRIHDALRRAERLGSMEQNPARDILSDSAPADFLAGIGASGNSNIVGEAPAEPGPYSAIATETAPSTPDTSPAITGSETGVLFPGFLDGQFRSPSWEAPNAEQLLFLQPENTHQVEREQFRTLRSRLYQMRATKPVRAILVSSALPGEGKTFVSVNLAMAITRQSGRRVLLVDADLRKPTLHRLLGAPVDPGLSEYLAGGADEVSVIQRAPISTLCFVPAGKTASNPGELIGNGRLKTLIEKVAPLFDWVIIDSPPAVPITDASLMAEATDGVLLVVKASSSPFDVVKKACAEFHRKPVLGVVLNHAGKVGMYGAYYDQHYGRHEGTAEDERGK